MTNEAYRHDPVGALPCFARTAGPCLFPVARGATPPGKVKDDDMPTARPEFMQFSEAEVWAAIENDDGGPIAAEVTRLIAEHTIRVKTWADQNRSVPGLLLKLRARCPIERVAVQIMADQGAGISLVTVN